MAIIRTIALDGIPEDVAGEPIPGAKPANLLGKQPSWVGVSLPPDGYGYYYASTGHIIYDNDTLQEQPMYNVTYTYATNTSEE
jgi:hypothetical protein